MRLVDEAAALGWRREELALQLADLADDYVLYLASRPNERASTTNDASVLRLVYANEPEPLRSIGE